MNEQPRRYTLAIDDRAIDDLSQRLARTRWPDQAPVSGVNDTTNGGPPRNGG
jgi:hypothetical protein